MKNAFLVKPAIDKNAKNILVGFEQIDSSKPALHFFRMSIASGHTLGNHLASVCTGSLFAFMCSALAEHHFPALHALKKYAIIPSILLTIKLSGVYLTNQLLRSQQ
jgi:hypothetical protein